MSAKVTSSTIPSTGTNPDGWRCWWTIESARVGSDWRSLLDQHQDVINRLRLAKVSS
jgi:hypothetical protein